MPQVTDYCTGYFYRLFPHKETGASLFEWFKQGFVMYLDKIKDPVLQIATGTLQFVYKVHSTVQVMYNKRN